MKIGFVYDVIYPYVKGGVEKRIWELSTRLARRGHDVHLFGMKYWEGPDEIVTEGVTLHGVCPPRDLYVDGRRSIAQAMWFGWKVLPVLYKSDLDVIDCQNFPYFPCFSSKIATSVRGIPLVITWHEVWGNYWSDYLGRFGFVGRTVERISAGLADMQIAVSPTTKQNLAALGVRADIAVVPNGIDPQILNDTPPAGQPSDLLFVGRLIKEKNVDLLLEALSLVQLEIPDIKLAIVGDGPERLSLERKAESYNVEKNVAFSGVLPDHEQVIGMMKASKVFVFPSRREGFGISVLEAMACGLPVVTVDHPMNAAGDLISDQTGFLCRQTPDDLSKAILEAIASRQTMRQACIEQVRAYDWEAIVSRLEHIYQAQLRG